MYFRFYAFENCTKSKIIQLWNPLIWRKKYFNVIFFISSWVKQFSPANYSGTNSKHSNLSNGTSSKNHVNFQSFWLEKGKFLPGFYPCAETLLNHIFFFPMLLSTKEKVVACLLPLHFSWLCNIYAAGSI